MKNFSLSLWTSVEPTVLKEYMTVFNLNSYLKEEE